MNKYKFPSCLEYPINPADYWSAILELNPGTSRERDAITDNLLTNYPIMTYAESKGLAPLINWKKLLKAATCNANINSKADATLWIDSPIKGPCGMLSVDLDRDQEGYITDVVLLDMYNKIFDAMEKYRWIDAYVQLKFFLDYAPTALENQEEAFLRAEEEEQASIDERATQRADFNWGRI